MEGSHLQDHNGAEDLRWTWEPDTKKSLCCNVAICWQPDAKWESLQQETTEVLRWDTVG